MEEVPSRLRRFDASVAFVNSTKRYEPCATPTVSIVALDLHLLHADSPKPVNHLFLTVIVSCRRHELVEHIPEVLSKRIAGNRAKVIRVRQTALQSWSCFGWAIQQLQSRMQHNRRRQTEAAGDESRQPGSNVLAHWIDKLLDPSIPFLSVNPGGDAAARLDMACKRAKSLAGDRQVVNHANAVRKCERIAKWKMQNVRLNYVDVGQVSGISKRGFHCVGKIDTNHCASPKLCR